MQLQMRPLNEKQIDSIHRATLELLSDYGITMRHAPSRDLLYQSGAIVEGEQVKIPESLVSRALQTVPPSFMVNARNPLRTVTIGGGQQPVLAPAAGAVYVSSRSSGRRRATRDDLVNFLRLSQTSDGIDVTDAGIVYPRDLSRDERFLVALLETIRTSDKPLVGFTGGRQAAEDSITMAEIALEGEKCSCVMGIVNSQSPLAWDKPMLEAIWVYANKSQPLVMTCCSMAGTTSPTTLTATVIQNNAEVLAGIVLAQLINPGAPVVYGNTSTVADMRSMNLCIGAPEYALLMAAFSQLARRYHLPFRSGGGLTDSKDLDVQAGMESATNLLCTFFSGVDFVLHAVGITESFLGVDYEKWVWDEEIIARIRRLSRGLGEIPESAVQLIARPVRHFIDSEDTLLNYKTEFFRPGVSDRNNWETWSSGDRRRDQGDRRQGEEVLQPDLGHQGLRLVPERDLRFPAL